MILREYQQRAVANLRAQFAAGKRAPLLVMPTGSGKTPCLAEIIRLSVSKGRRVLFVAGRVELLDQCVRKLADAGVTGVRVIQADRDDGPPDAMVIVASVQTLASARWLSSPPDADLLIVDEAAHVKAATWFALAQKYPLRIGATATPARGDNSPLGDAFDCIVVGAQVAELITQGYLVPCKVFAPPTIMDPRTIAMEPVDAYLRHCPGTRSVVFAVTVAHAVKIAESFRAHGIAAEHVSGAMSNRPDVLERHAAGEFPVLVNVSLVVEGYDDPAISSTIFAKRFTYVAGYLQAIGRTLRPFPGKRQAICVDLCGSALVHGTPDLEREYSLDGEPISAAETFSVRQCAACFAVFQASDTCPRCGESMPTVQRALPVVSGVGVSEIAQKATPTSWPMKAKKRGLCAGCGHETKPGDWIVWSATRRQGMHPKCAHAAAKARAA